MKSCRARLELCWELSALSRWRDDSGAAGPCPWRISASRFSTGRREGSASTLKGGACGLGVHLGAVARQSVVGMELARPRGAAGDRSEGHGTSGDILDLRHFGPCQAALIAGTAGKIDPAWYGGQKPRHGQFALTRHDHGDTGTAPVANDVLHQVFSP